MAAGDPHDSDYGSETDATALNKILSIIDASRPRTAHSHVDNKPQRNAAPSDYGSDFDTDSIESDYGSDVDENTAERLLLNATPVRQRVPLRVDIQTLQGCQPQTKSCLLSLPPELRNLLYETLFDDFTAEWIVCKFYRPPSLLLACKQIYSEAISVFYLTATFRARDIGLLERRVDRLRHCHRRMITRLDIDTQHSYSYGNGFARRGNRERLASTIYEHAEHQLAAVRASFSERSSLKEVTLRSLRASMKLPNAELVWTSEPEKAWLAYEEEQKRKQAEKDAEAKKRRDEARKASPSRVILTENDMADGVWSNSLQAFVFTISD